MQLQRLVLALVLAGAAASVAGAADVAEDSWASEPSSSELAAALPPAARTGDVRIALRCRAAADGAVSDCRVLSELPGGIGAGQAVARLAPKYRLKQEAISKMAPSGEVTILVGRMDADAQPDWRKRPTPNDLLAVWPSSAWKRGVNGQATINCLVSTTGTLFDCVVLTESPPGESFGAAAIALTPQLLMTPAMRGGKPVISTVSIPVSFKGAERSLRPRGDTAASKRVLPPAMSWAQAPDRTSVVAAYPKAALANKLAGYASVKCGFTRQGRPWNCDVVREEPKGQGFGRAAKELASQFRLAPADLPGFDLATVEVTLPVSFDPSGEATVRKPLWTRLAEPEVMQAAYARIKPTSHAGRATLSCRVKQGGALETCELMSEEPAGSRLGEVALALQQEFRVSSWSDEGLPVVGQTVRLPFRFDFDQTPPPPIAPTAKPQP